MEALAKGQYLRSSTLRMRQVADLVRGKPVEAALGLLYGLSLRKKSAKMVEKVLKSAVANYQVKLDTAGAGKAKNLVVKTITVDAGPLMKRIRAHAQGRAFRIEKKLSHLTVVVSD
jgi:large subunit ribosomal protein L22